MRLVRRREETNKFTKGGGMEQRLREESLNDARFMYPSSRGFVAATVIRGSCEPRYPKIAEHSTLISREKRRDQRVFNKFKFSILTLMFDDARSARASRESQNRRELFRFSILF